jgi:hypothetical protein
VNRWSVLGVGGLRERNHGAVWFKKCNAKGNGNGLHSITVGNMFE